MKHDAVSLAEVLYPLFDFRVLSFIEVNDWRLDGILRRDDHLETIFFGFATPTNLYFEATSNLKDNVGILA